MITGYNTDVRYGELVLHVQTEDKGQGNPCVESLIYFGGQVVVAKRANYAELLEDGKGKEEILALMEQQHRTMIKAIRAGKFDDKIQEFASVAPTSLEDTAVLEQSEGSQTLDQVILDYLTNEAEQEQLVLVMEDSVELRAGTRAALSLRTRSSRDGEPVAGAQVNVKMISTLGGPDTLADGETDAEGFLELPVEIPLVDRGTAALIITAASGIGQAELKQLL